MKKNEGILKHFFIIGAGTFFNLLLGVITTPIITRIVDPIEYGKLSIFTMYSNIALMVLCMGLDQALVRYYYNNEDVKSKSKLLLQCIIIPIIISIILSVFVIITSYLELINYEFDTYIIILLCIYIIIQIIYRFSLAIVRLEYNSKLYSKLNILLKILYIGIAFPCLLYFKKNYLLILIIATIASAFICMFLSIIAQIKIWKIFSNKRVNNNITLNELIKYAYPFVFSMSITTLFQAIDKISLNYFRSYSEVGIYSSAMSLIHVFAIVQTTFNTLWTPIAVKHYTSDREDKKFYQQANQVITVIMFFIGLSLILVKDLFAILLGNKYREAAYILPFLIFNPIMYTISETTVGGLVFKKKSKSQVIVAIGSCITNFIGNLILVPKFGCQGAAISTGISYIVFFSLRTILANKYYYIDFKLKKIYLLTFVTILYAYYNTFVKFNIISIIGYIVCLLILFILYKKTIILIIKYIYNNLLKKNTKINK